MTRTRMNADGGMELPQVAPPAQNDHQDSHRAQQKAQLEPSQRLQGVTSAGLVRARTLGGLLCPLGLGLSARDRIARLAHLLAVCVPVGQVLVLLVAIWTKTAAVPYWDEWTMTRVVQRANDGTLSLADLWAQNNEHRPLLQRLTDLGLIDLTHWNRQIMMTFDLLMAVVGVALLLWAARRALGSHDWWFALLAPLSLFLLSWGQWENWFWPWQLGFIGVGVGTAICFAALHTPGGVTRSNARFALAILGAAIASLSSAGGLLVWIAFAPSVARAGYRKLAPWTAPAAGIWALYLIGFQRAFKGVASVSTMAQYALAYLGSPAGAADVHLCEFFGLFSLALLAANLVLYYRLKRTLAPLVVWLSLALYTLGNDAVTTYGRAVLGLDQSVSSRYQVFTAVWWVTLLVISALVIQGYTRQRALPWPSQTRLIVLVNLVALVLICAGALATNARGVELGLAQERNQRVNQQCVLDYQTAPDSCIAYYIDLPEKGVFLQDASYLQQHHLALWYSQGNP